MRVKFKRVDQEGCGQRGELAILPTYAHGAEDAGMDIYSAESITLWPGERANVRNGLLIELEPGYEAQVRTKSGRALKDGLIVLNSPGTIDPGYRGEIGALLMNVSDKAIFIAPGQKIAQLVIAKVEHAEVELVEELSDSSRGEGGFGSTGIT